MIKITEEQIIKTAFNYYRKCGFPYLFLQKYEILTLFKKLQETKSKINKYREGFFNLNTRIIEVKHINDSMLANHFHPHIYESHAQGMKSPLTSFYIDKSLKKVMRLCLKYDNEITKRMVNTFLRTVSGTQMCSNFRPAAAKAVYDYFNANNVLDMSTGYGGRLLGFLASNSKGFYYGVDPHPKTCACNNKIAKFFKQQNRVKIICSPFEDVENLPKSIDLAFTSTPYFTKEIYDENSKTQSRERYPEYAEWCKYFLKPLIQKTYNVLEKSGVMALNINDVTIKNKRYPLVEDTLKLAKSTGFKTKEKLFMRFSSFGKNLDKVKTEPILIFEK